MLYLTYNTNINNDGMGAQYQRIIGIICIAIYYNITYVHSPIKKMEHIDDIDYIKKIENFFGIEKNFQNVNFFSYDKIISEKNPSIDKILYYHNLNENILIKIYLPYNICEKNTNIYNNGMIYLRTILNSKFIKDNIMQTPNHNSSQKKNINIHIRRGDVSATKNNDRYIDINNYISLTNTLKNKYNDYNIIIFTQINKNNKNEFDIFNNDKFITIRANDDLLTTFKNLINADVLVMSTSSFSYLAGLYNPNIIYYYNFWHKPLNNWINVNILYDIDNSNINIANKLFMKIKESFSNDISTNKIKYCNLNKIKFILILFVFFLLFYYFFNNKLNVKYIKKMFGCGSLWSVCSDAPQMPASLIGGYDASIISSNNG